MCTEMWLSTTTHTTLGERHAKHAFALFIQIPFNYLYISGHKHSLVSESKTILGDFTENSTFSLFSSPPYSISLTYSGNLWVGIGSMSGPGERESVVC